MLTIIVLLLLSGCGNKLISKTEEKVEVTIIDTYHKDSELKLHIWSETKVDANGHVSVVPKQVWYPSNEINKVIFEYDNKKYYIDDKETYNKYINCSGKKTIGNLVTKKYKDGDEIMYFESIE